MRLLGLILCLLPAVVKAESDTVGRTLRGVVLPAFQQLADTTDHLAKVAALDCTASNPALKDAYMAAADAWIGVQLYRAGPLETDGRGLAIAFWPDLKGATPKLLKALVAQGDAAETDGYARNSVAMRGLFALEAMLFDPTLAGYAAQDAGCRVTQAITADLAATVAQVNDDWTSRYAPLLLTAGASGNARFLSPDEAIQSLYTAALTELEYDAETRIGRPLGEPDRPRPNRAEARLSGRSLHNVDLSIAAVRKLSQSLAGVDETVMFASFDAAQVAAKAIHSPDFSDINTPQGIARLQALQKAVQATREAVVADLGLRLGVGVGFNALDGD